ncbi:competence protein ComF [Shewanella mangrovi]|uniref:Competence protein ComF n=1 Tax=Shewanella mangrovi TaxID=1515746 RepID=A0A094JYP7_9GAMM|nr:ComF family protein [Shewanella mangrovi]KFZ37551.1 competence protein ComF [Shewanella mangrovi]
MVSRNFAVRWTQLANILPNRCLLCHQTIASPQRGVCHACLASCLYQTEICLGCGKPIYVLAEYCGHCVKHRPISVVAPASYHTMLGQLIPAIKYQAQFAALPALVEALAKRIEHLCQNELLTLPQVLIPVPLHRQRLIARGYNQAWLIADALSKRLQIPMDDQLLLRVAHTPAQAQLSGKQRRQNLADAFALRRASPYQRIALIDDVVTTGSTIDAIARVLSPSAPHIQAWCLARAEAPALKE